MKKRNIFFLGFAVAVISILLLSLLMLSGRFTKPHVTAVLAGYDKTVYVTRENGRVMFELRGWDGIKLLSPDSFARLVYKKQASNPWWFTPLNISSPYGVVWVLLGLCGQLLFSGRMLVQWIASEKLKRSVVPVAFWWLALGGASMLLVYFAWRRDIIGILGQGTGWLIYVRNLYFISKERSAQNSNAAEAEKATDAKITNN